MKTYRSFYAACRAEARRRAKAGDEAAQAALDRKDVPAIEAFGKDLEAHGLLFLRERNGRTRASTCSISSRAWAIGTATGCFGCR